MTLPNPWAILGGAVAGILLITGSGLVGYRYRANEDAKAQAKIYQQLAAADRQSAILQQSLDTETKLHQLTYINLKMEISPNVNLIVSAPGQAPVSRPAYYLTAFDVCLYNSGLQGSDPATVVTGSTACTSAANPYGLTPIDFGLLLENVLENGDQYADCRTNLRGWQQWYNNLPKSSRAP